jgi:hypothetical protein
MSLSFRQLLSHFMFGTNLRALVLPIALCALPLFAQGADVSGADPQDPNVIGVQFDTVPKENGLTFDRTNVSPATLNVDGRQCQIWVANKSIEPTRDWSRSFRFKVTNPLFENGKRHVVDIEITYSLPLYGELDIKADTIDGAKLLGKVWTQQDEVGKWKTYHIELNNAFFGARSDPKDAAPKLEGYDLRLDSNCDLKLRGVRITGYDPDQDIRWNRMLSAAQPVSSAPGGIYLFQQAPRQTLTTVLTNLSHVSRPLFYSAEISGYDDKSRFRQSGAVNVPAGGSSPLAIGFDSTGWPLGPYDGKIDIFLNQGDAQPLVARTFRMGVITATNLDKARPGEFLYGLDAANNDIYPTHTEGAFAFYRLMGVDILRNPFDKGMSRTPADLGKALSDLAAQKLRSVIGVEMPRDYDPKRRQAQLMDTVAQVEEEARLYGGKGPGKAHYFELGNEPDLPFFNPFPMAEYASHYYAIYNAIKKGSSEAGGAPDDTQVMNGGLSFAGTTGDARSREFLKLVDISKVDIIAYHGHGPDIGAERMAYERVYQAAAKYGKAVKPFAETESGVSASNRLGLIDQARTVIEKMTYAQSVHEPFFLFFRLFMEGENIEGGYGMTQNLLEPRPSVLSYRNMVERLRHFRYVKSLDFENAVGARRVDAFLFAEVNAHQEFTGRKTLVAFCENPVQYQLRISLAKGGIQVGSPAVYDMYGNSLPANLTSNVAAVQVGLDPVYLSWNSPGGTDDVAVAPPVLLVRASEPILVGATTSVPIILRNPGAQPVEAELDASARTRVAAQVQPASQKILLPPYQAVNAVIKIRLGASNQPLALPMWWKVFPDVDYSQLAPGQLANIPDELPGKNGPVTGQYTWATGNHIDIAKIAGSGPKEKRPAVVYAIIDSPENVTLECGASADWWMVWYLNGQKVYDTLAQGNLDRNLAVHSFKLSLKRGRNIIAVGVLSGTFGWALDFGGPKELQISRTGGESPDSITVNLRADGQLLATQRVPVEIQSPVPPLGQMKSPNQPGEWMPLEPLAVLGEQEVKNFWMKEPDASKWYHGESDLSGKLWLRDDGQNLHLFAAIADDKLVQAKTPADLAKNDSIHIVICNDAGTVLVDSIGGLINNTPVMLRATPHSIFSATRDENPAQPTTCYHLSIPKAALGNQPIHLNVTVADNDSSFLKQILQFGDTEQPVAGPRLFAAP